MNEKMEQNYLTTDYLPCGANYQLARRAHDDAYFKIEQHLGYYDVTAHETQTAADDYVEELERCRAGTGDLERLRRLTKAHGVGSADCLGDLILKLHEEYAIERRNHLVALEQELHDQEKGETAEEGDTAPLRAQGEAPAQD